MRDTDFPLKRLRIAFVGNGQLTPGQQDALNGYDLVFRCNHMPSCRKDDKVTHLFLGPNPKKSYLFNEVSGGYIYFDVCHEKESLVPVGGFIKEMMSASQSERLEKASLLQLIQNEPTLREKVEPLSDKVECGSHPSRPGWRYTGFSDQISLGLKGFAYLMHHYPEAEIDLFGFNWKGSAVNQIDWEAEQRIITELMEERRQLGLGGRVYDVFDRGAYYHIPIIEGPVEQVHAHKVEKKSAPALPIASRRFSQEEGGPQIGG